MHWKDKKNFPIICTSKYFFKVWSWNKERVSTQRFYKRIPLNNQSPLSVPPPSHLGIFRILGLFLRFHPFREVSIKKKIMKRQEKVVGPCLTISGSECEALYFLHSFFTPYIFFFFYIKSCSCLQIGHFDAGWETKYWLEFIQRSVSSRLFVTKSPTGREADDPESTVFLCPLQ